METAYLIETVIKIVVILLIFSALAGIGTYFERKVLAFMQRRLGPVNVGPFGLLQVAADGIKLFTKEDIVPTNVVARIFKIAPVITAATAFMAAAAIPFLPSFTLFGYEVHPIVADINIGILYILGIMGVGLYGPLLGGMASANKFSLLSAARGAAVFISYEVVTGLSILAPIMMVGSLSLIDFNEYQAGGFTSWILWSQPVAFLLFWIAAFAETGRTPFHLIANDHEIIDGFGTEYSGMRWGLFFIGEYANMFFISFVISIIFLGGYGDGSFLGAIGLLLKVAFFFFFFLWTRAAWPDVRPDQLMWLCWKVLMPIAVINIVITGIVMM
ncbi:MAG: NADH-quinone oxidoreductase subunit H [Sulfurimonas sp. RIFCSPLOWO2_12_FULL_36_74]|uniref:NADH-quinone oxidoreductase subunit NuoH n=1 Tax=Sulfurimonas sp. RIFCSPLOWO2_12_36_12 TaxID=1802253 RepID=UPI0008CB662F|nr:NADH-quinone oxidoreductase subunit NuoH [Sulfurimonas sp. RIFCSPLOWO2_12_36_12]OHD99668.1 MAG: NADH-quinone oxidoreductase subunit H [Sulfurimonas sp. RIFCSPLOWO2_02_FULL_36_28]OHE01303.1 MAG: NADH-quinone oxidoreductase subunit H [Sulfurimonas sp. RIFCSPLOWO2_12_36_12]OHE03786.1 MAG: NADH-quinone oxidoreductase subunit H [Sulfurimonas sp. RIFCSPLOWO2_12_FULL_36_74]